MEKKLKNWGNYPIVQSDVVHFDTISSARSVCSKKNHKIARGMGRCYGDASLGDHVISTQKFNRVISFDAETGVIECQAGFSLDDVLKLSVPKGWFLPVTPGTKYVSVGGAVASDIHGKNHHKEGSFSNHILELTILCGDGKTYKCSKIEHPDLFEATCGGMGLTGLILNVKFQLKKVETAYISQKQIKASNLDELLRLFEKHKDYTYSVAWVDCLAQGNDFGRSILILGEHARMDELQGKASKAPLKTHTEASLNVPFNFPAFTLNKLSIKLFNIAYYGKNLKKVQDGIVHYDGFFYPLDNILNWNRMYGKTGFLQYQFVLPLDRVDGLKHIMNRIAEKKQGSFLSVLKVFGPQDDMIAFPHEGYTLALDFPMKSGILDFLDELDDLVRQYGGRIYLTKDARMDKKFFKESYPRFDEFVSVVKKYNPNMEFRSTQSDRLAITR